MSAPSIGFEGDVRRAVIWGYGVEGSAALKWLRTTRPEAEITLIDQRAVEAPADRVVREGDAAVEARLAEADLVIRSAGVPPHRSELARAADRGTPVRTGMDLWMNAADPARVIGVTGTKGKSTTVGLTHAILRASGVEAALAGNIGTAMLDLAPPQAGEVVVVEISSYQACDLTAGPGVMGLTSLYRDHLTWHGGVAAYRAAKLRPFALSTCRARVAPAAHRALLDLAGLSVIASDDARLAEDLPPAFRAPEAQTNLKTALTLARTWLDDGHALDEAVAKVATDWKGAPSRRRELGRFGASLAVDDALATIPEATAAALAAYPNGSMTLLLGGADRGQDFAPLLAALRHRGGVHCVVSGGVGRRLAEALTDVLGADAVSLVSNFAEAAAIATHPPVREIILFSPSAASDPPQTYQDRAAIFAEFVQSLAISEKKMF